MEVVVNSSKISTTALALAASTLLLASTAAVFTVEADAARPKAPKNVIVMVGDGMGFGAVDLLSLYQQGRSFGAFSGDPGSVRLLKGQKPTQVFERFPVRTSMSTYGLGGSYDPALIWSSFDQPKVGANDSAATATSMSTGLKTPYGVVGRDGGGNDVENLTERAAAVGKSAGVVSSVPFSHATPAGFSTHNGSRNDLWGIAHSMLTSDLDVIFSPGHPWYNDNHQPLATPAYSYLSPADYEAVSTGATGFTYVHSTSDFEALASASLPTGDTAPRYVGLAEVGSNLQWGRSGATNGVLPGSVPANDVPSLATMAVGAANTLAVDRDGFFLMIEGGAIDLAAHRGQTTRLIEETQSFAEAVRQVVAWVEAKSSWGETLLIVTADHETGYVVGQGSGAGNAGPDWVAWSGRAGQLPLVQYSTSGHTNQLVPLYAKGIGSDALMAAADQSDPVRGRYLDNTEIAQAVFRWWKR